MANGIKTRPVRRMTQAELDGFLEKAADILHGVSPSGWTPKQEDSLRQPLHLDANKKLRQFDRIVMNPHN